MYKKIRIVLILIFISIWTCPAGMHTVIVRAATVRTQKLDLSKAADSAQNATEGWQWIKNSDGSYTLILQDFTLDTTDTNGIILPRDKDVSIILKGRNTITCTQTGLAENWVILFPGEYKTKTVEGDGSLELNAPCGLNLDNLILNSGSLVIDSENAFLGGLVTNESYIQNGGAVSVTVTGSEGLYLIGEFQLHGGTLDINAPDGIGIFTDDGSAVYNAITIDGGALSIQADRGLYRNRREQVDADITMSNADISIHSTRTAISNILGNIIIHDLTSWDVKAPQLYGGNVTLQVQPADYIRLHALLKQVNDLNEALYMSNGRNALQESMKAVKMDKHFYEQDEVDAMYTDIKAKIDALVYLSADYTGIHDALQKVPAQIECYTDASRQKLYDLILNIPWDKNITEQKILDTYAKSLVDAINQLELKPQPAPVIPALIVQGANQSIRQGEQASFTANTAYEEFIALEIDENIISPNQYTVKEGSTVITLLPDCTKQLQPGMHTLRIISSTGIAECSFTIITAAEKDQEQPVSPSSDAKEIKKEKSKAPFTGNTTYIELWYLLSTVTLTGMGCLLLRRKNQKDKM